MKRIMFGACALACATLLAGAETADAQDFFSRLFGGGGWAPPPSASAAPIPRKAAKAKTKKQAKPQQPAGPQQNAATPPPEGPPPPYEPQLLRLSEILGALTFLRDLCGEQDGEEWRAKMSTLLDAEAKAGQRRAKLAGAFNRGFHGYEITYRSCTDNARSAIVRYLDEGGKIAHDIAYRYGAT
jgi:uncharacterized protein (TIGR02301 family)